MRFKMHRGDFLKPCPCSPGAVACGLANANLHTGCPYRCSYCILQGYLDSMEPVFFRNWRNLVVELAAAAPRAALRLTTGELSDSLALEDRFALSRKLLPLAEKFGRIVFEFKTKSARVGGILAYPRVPSNVIVSWSLAPQEIIAREEKGAPPLPRRLAAMAAVLARGYKIGIHFDPIVLFPHWRERYRELIGAIAAVAPAGRIAWWSLGALRFQPALKAHIFKRKDSLLFWGELVPGFDGKYRYFKPLRLDLFRFMKREIQAALSREVPLYLCMEDGEAWSEVLPEISPDPVHINRFLYESAMGE